MVVLLLASFLSTKEFWIFIKLTIWLFLRCQTKAFKFSQQPDQYGLLVFPDFFPLRMGVVTERYSRSAAWHNPVSQMLGKFSQSFGFVFIQTFSRCWHAAESTQVSYMTYRTLQKLSFHFHCGGLSLVWRELIYLKSSKKESVFLNVRKNVCWYCIIFCQIEINLVFGIMKIRISWKISTSEIYSAAWPAALIRIIAVTWYCVSTCNICF